MALRRSVLIPIDDYDVDIRTILGKGAFGIVYKGFHRVTKAPIAAKNVMYKEEDGHINEYLINMGKNELEIFRQLRDHANVVELLHHHDDGEGHWLFMEYCDLGDLPHYLQRETPGNTQKFKIMYECTSAINYMHSFKPAIIHRDIKPQNVLMIRMQSQDVAKITDFGIGKLLELSPAAMHNTMTTLAGTASYMAPEFFDGGYLRYKPSVDIFSLGLLFHVLMKYDGSDSSFMPLSTEVVKSKIMVHFGQEMSHAIKINLPLPVLFEDSPLSDLPESRLKHLIKDMIKYREDERIKPHTVKDKLVDIYIQSKVSETQSKFDSAVLELNEMKNTQQEERILFEEKLSLLSNAKQQIERECLKFQEEEVKLRDKLCLERKEYVQEKEKYENEIQNTKEELKELRSLNEKYEEEKCEYEKKIDSYKKELESLHKNYQPLDVQLKDKTDGVSAANKNSNQQIKESSSNLKRDENDNEKVHMLEEIESLKSTLQAERAKFETVTKKKDQDILDVLSCGTRADSVIFRELNRQLEKDRNILQQNELERKELEATIKQLQSEVSERRFLVYCRQSIKDIKELEQRFHPEIAEQQKLQEEEHEMKGYKIWKTLSLVLQNDIIHLQDIRKELEEVTQELQNRDNDIRLAKDANTSLLQTEASNVQILKAELEQVKQELDDLKKENKEIKDTEGAKTTSEDDILAQLKNELLEVKQFLQNKEKPEDKLSTQMEDYRYVKDKVEYVDLVKDLQQTIQDLKEELEDKDEHMKNQRLSFEDEICTQRIKVKQVEFKKDAEINDLMKEIEGLKVKINSIEKQKSMLQRELSLRTAKNEDAAGTKPKKTSATTKVTKVKPEPKTISGLTPAETEVWENLHNIRMLIMKSKLRAEHLQRCIEERIMVPWSLGTTEWNVQQYSDSQKTMLINMHKDYACVRIRKLKHALLETVEEEEKKNVIETSKLTEMLGGKSMTAFDHLTKLVSNEELKIHDIYIKREENWKEMDITSDEIWSAITSKPLLYMPESASNTSAHTKQNVPLSKKSRSIRPLRKDLK